MLTVFIGLVYVREWFPDLLTTAEYTYLVFLFYSGQQLIFSETRYPCTCTHKHAHTNMHTHTLHTYTHAHTHTHTHIHTCT